MEKQNIVKYITFSIVILITFAISLAVAYWKGVTSFLFAWILNFMLMTAVLSFTQTFSPTLQSNYYQTKAWEKRGKIYRWMGVDFFRKLLVWTGWEKLNKTSKPVKKDMQALITLERGTRESEFGHLIIFFIVSAIALAVGWHHGVVNSAWLHLLNIILNVYPIALQRYNRPRLQQAISSMQRV
ncbi:MAG TPA: hypothetical protein VK014_12085 [Cyclobacteriaceae bacterium]|nr:hypothetical protein [Cyclobacteriaceae bacterium]